MSASRTTGSASTSRLFALLSAALVALYAVSTIVRPPGVVWDRCFDAWLFNLAYLPVVALGWRASRRLRPERNAWRAVSAALLLFAVANVLRTLATGVTGRGPSPVLSTLLAAAGYVLVYVTMIVLIRARVQRFHPSMWLDGLIGALGATAICVAFLLGPYLSPAPGRPGIEVDAVAWLAGDVLMLALLVAVGSILGVRMDRVLVAMTTAMALVCFSDVQLFVRSVEGTYTDGGPLDLGWLTGVLLVGLAAHSAAVRGPVPVEDRGGSRLGWQLLALPLACIVASVLVLGVGWGDRLPTVAAWLAIGCVVAGIARTGVTFREVRGFNEVREQARTDELTGLPNRRALLTAARDELAEATARRPAALLLLDLDGFKEVNDSLGHHAGDTLLRQIGPRLQGGLRTGDLLARLGGDEFAVLLRNTGLDEAQRRAERLRALVLRPFPVEDIRLHVGVSIGVATAPVPAASVEELLRCADVAMYAAKAGREGVHVYVPDPHGGTGDRLRLMEELRTALEGDELEVHLQPQVSLLDGDVVGAEALVRWRHPTRGLLSPAQLLPAAEQAGLLLPLTDLVVELSLTAAAGWWPRLQVPISVNLSAANVSDLDLPGKVVRALMRHGLPPEGLTLELVEDTLMDDPERGRMVLAELRALGIRTSIDDYGTGYSSLAYLRHLPADELKLDRSLTSDVHTDRRAAAIVRHTAGLAHDLGLRLVAEGVEDAVTGRALARLGCDVAQGYAIARPMPVADFVPWLETPRTFLLDSRA